MWQVKLWEETSTGRRDSPLLHFIQEVRSNHHWHSRSFLPLHLTTNSKNQWKKTYIHSRNEATKHLTIEFSRKGLPPIFFYDKELVKRIPKSNIPLLVRVFMVNYDVLKVLLDQGNSCDMIYANLLENIDLTRGSLIL